MPPLIGWMCASWNAGRTMRPSRFTTRVRGPTYGAMPLSGPTYRMVSLRIATDSAHERTASSVYTAPPLSTRSASRARDGPERPGPTPGAGRPPAPAGPGLGGAAHRGESRTMDDEGLRICVSSPGILREEHKIAIACPFAGGAYLFAGRLRMTQIARQSNRLAVLVFVSVMAVSIGGAMGPMAGRAGASPSPQKVSPESCMACGRPADWRACHETALALAMERDWSRAIAVEEGVRRAQPRNAEIAAVLARMYQEGTRSLPRAFELYHEA